MYSAPCSRFAWYFPDWLCEHGQPLLYDMAKCDYCGTGILFGGERRGDARFCNKRCLQNGVLLSVARTVPIDVLEQSVEKVHQGTCPNCSRPGPIDVHTSHSVWSALIMTSWRSTPQVCCRRCGNVAKLRDSALSLFIGWWGFPWGLIMTPVQISRNVFGLFSSADPAAPSKMLHRMVCLNIAAQLQNAPVPAGPPPLPSQR
jgi:hypothetical protein